MESLLNRIKEQNLDTTNKIQKIEVYETDVYYVPSLLRCTLKRFLIIAGFIRGSGSPNSTVFSPFAGERFYCRPSVLETDDNAMIGQLEEAFF